MKKKRTATLMERLIAETRANTNLRYALRTALDRIAELERKIDDLMEDR